jgi:hypothetical protein
VIEPVEDWAKESPVSAIRRARIETGAKKDLEGDFSIWHLYSY